jgi:hypothetical protein
LICGTRGQVGSEKNRAVALLKSNRQNVKSEFKVVQLSSDMNLDRLGSFELLELTILRARECRLIVEKDPSDISVEDLALARSKLVEIIVRVQAVEGFMEEIRDQIRALSASLSEV